MLNKIMGALSNERGQVTLVEIVILVAIIAVIAVAFGTGLQGVFTGTNGATTKLQTFVTGKFNQVTTP